VVGETKMRSKQVAPEVVDEALNAPPPYKLVHANTAKNVLALASLEAKIFSENWGYGASQDLQRCEQALEEVQVLIKMHKVNRDGYDYMLEEMENTLNKQLSTKTPGWCEAFCHIVAANGGVMREAVIQRCTKIIGVQVQLLHTKTELLQMQIEQRIRAIGGLNIGGSALVDEAKDENLLRTEKKFHHLSKEYLSKNKELSADVSSSLSALATVSVLTFSVTAAWTLNMGARGWTDNVDSVLRPKNLTEATIEKYGEAHHECRVTQSLLLTFDCGCLYACVVLSVILRLYISLSSNLKAVHMVSSMTNFPANRGYNLLFLPLTMYLIGFFGFVGEFGVFMLCRYHLGLAVVGVGAVAFVIGILIYAMAAAQRAMVPITIRHRALLSL